VTYNSMVGVGRGILKEDRRPWPACSQRLRKGDAWEKAGPRVGGTCHDLSERKKHKGVRKTFRWGNEFQQNVCGLTHCSSKGRRAARGPGESTQWKQGGPRTSKVHFNVKKSPKGRDGGRGQVGQKQKRRRLRIKKKNEGDDYSERKGLLPT